MILDDLRQTLIGVVRIVRRFPGLSVAVVLTMGLGIGANATMYGIIDRLLLQPPDHIVNPDAVRRVLVARPNLAGQMGTQSALAYPDYADLKTHTGMSVAAYSHEGEQTIGNGEAPARARTILASAELFPLLGVQPHLGRFFDEAEAAAGAPVTAVLSEEYWRRAYGADPDVLGRVIEVEGNPVQIIGVAPVGFTGIDLEPVDIWLPLEASNGVVAADCGLTVRNCYWFGAVARLNDGVSIEEAEVEATGLHRNGRRDEMEARTYPESAAVKLAPLIAAAGPEASGESRVAKWLTGVSLIVVLIACLNVANLLLARGTRLRRETAVRLALGASRYRLAAQATLESVALAILGGGLALAIARWGGELVRDTLLPGVYFPHAAMNGRVVAFTLVASVLAGVLAGFGPAVQGSRAEVTGDLANGSRGNSGDRSRTRAILTVSQAAMSVVLLIGAGLFIRSLTELRSQDLGLDTERLLLASFEFVREPEPAIQRAAFEEAARRASVLPVVEAVSGTATPFGMSMAVRVRVPGADSIPRLAGGGPYVNAVDPRYFATAGLTITSGRPIDDSDRPGAAPAAVVNETMARTLWPQANPLGECLMVGNALAGCTTVVGVVEDAARYGYQEEPFMSYYLAIAQADGVQGSRLSVPQGLLIRVRGDARAARSTVASALGGIAPEVRWVRVSSLREMLDPQARTWTLGAAMFTVFGLLALLVAAVGLYSVLAFGVAQRTREIGIRSALGAARLRLLGRVMLDGTSLALLGVAIGLAVAAVAAPYASELLFQVSPRDPLVLASVAGIFLVVGGLASLLPGLRASRVDPMIALRAD